MQPRHISVWNTNSLKKLALIFTWTIPIGVTFTMWIFCPITHSTLLLTIYCLATSFDLVYRYRHTLAWWWPIYEVKNNCQTINNRKGVCYVWLEMPIHIMAPVCSRITLTLGPGNPEVSELVVSTGPSPCPGMGRACKHYSIKTLYYMKDKLGISVVL